MPAQAIKIAILAMGGEGGGVLADWIVDLAEHNGYLAQTTSVPGVAQRTGATIYYLEMYPQAQAQQDGATPVLALMPLPGDVDVVLASELMEAGRAVQRGLVTPDRTTLIASTHRVYSITEKTAMGDGRVDSLELLGHAEAAAARFVRFDMAQQAESAGSVISAVLFGALGGVGVLPFSRAQFEATITRGGVGVKPSLKAFTAGFETANLPLEPLPAVAAAPVVPLDRIAHPALRSLVQRVREHYPAALQPLLTEGVKRLVDYQDVDYARSYLDRMQALCALPVQDEGQLVQATARHLALWMSYEDTIRVADLKTRGTRFTRVQAEARVDPTQVLAINEFMHPRLQEICETLPAGLGRWLLRSKLPRQLVERFTQSGRVVRTNSMRGFFLLWSVSQMKRWRRSTLRYAQENERIEQWLARIANTAKQHAALALEVALCQRLVKGYSDTYERGVHNYTTIMAAVDKAGTRLAPATLRELREAALADEKGLRLAVVLQRNGLNTGHD